MKLVTQIYQKKGLFQEIPAPKNTQVQVPRWPFNFASGIKTKFKDFSREMYIKKSNSLGPVDFIPGS